MFELKPECEKECSPFFYHYTRMDHSKASGIVFFFSCAILKYNHRLPRLAEKE